MRALVVATFGWCAVAEASPHALSLYEAKAQAIAHNPALGRAERAVDQATAAIEEQGASYDTQLAVDAKARRERAQPRDTAFTQLLARDQTAISAALTRVFRQGGEARFGVALLRDEAVTRLPSQLVHEDAAETTIAPRVEGSLRQPLWGGRQARAATEINLRETHRAVGFDAQALASTTLRDVTHAYWQLYLAQREVAIRGEARAAAEAQLRQATAEIERGARARLSGIELEDALTRLREDELIAAASIAERSLDLARVIGIAPTTELRATDEPGDLEVPSHGSLEHAPALVAAEARIDASRADLARTVDDTRWRVDAVISGSLSTPRDRLRVALDDTAAYGGWVIEVGLEVRGPLTDRAVSAKRAGARARLVSAELARREVESQLAGDLVRLANRRELARQRRLALVRSIELAQQNLQAERNRWERGDTTSFELLRRQATLADTRLRLERARVDELEADAGAAAAYGTLRY